MTRECDAKECHDEARWRGYWGYRLANACDKHCYMLHLPVLLSVSDCIVSKEKEETMKREELSDVFTEALRNVAQADIDVSFRKVSGYSVQCYMKRGHDSTAYVSVYPELAFLGALSKFVRLASVEQSDG